MSASGGTTATTFKSGVGGFWINPNTGAATMSTGVQANQFINACGTFQNFNITACFTTSQSTVCPAGDVTVPN